MQVSQPVVNLFLSSCKVVESLIDWMWMESLIDHGPSNGDSGLPESDLLRPLRHRNRDIESKMKAVVGLSCVTDRRTCSGFKED